MTASLILTWTTSIGLGFLVEHRRFGIATAFGVVAIPAALFVFGTLFGLPLSLISWALAGFAAVGWLFQVRRWRALEMPFLEPLHPTLILLIVVLILAVAVGPEHYTPIAWDEFSSWLYWTKQQFLADAAERSDMYISLPGYPQAWPLAMTFPHTFFSQFDGLRSISVGVIVYIAILGLTYDLVRQVISLRANYSDQFARIVAWGVTLLLASGELAWRLVPETTLIEQPQVLFLIAATLFGVLALSRPDDQLRGAAGLGAFVAVGYLVKVAMLVYIPSAIIFVVALSIQAEDWRRRTAIAGIALAPMMFAVIAWRMAGPDQLSAAASPLSVLWQIISTGQANFDGGAAILENYWDRTLRFINWARLPITLIAVVGVVLALLDRVGRIAMLALIAFIGAYIASLGFSYVFLFTGYEQEVLASLERYEEVPVRLLQYFGLLALALALLSIFHALPDGFVSRITRHRSGQIVGALACFGLLVHVGNETRETLVELRDRAAVPSDRLQTIQRIVDGAAAIRTTSSVGNNRQIPTVVLVAQGSNGWERVILRYQALGIRGGGSLRAFEIAENYSWGPTPANIWTRTTTPPDLEANFRQVDIIWPYHTDDWIRPILARLTEDQTCLKAAPRILLVRRSAPREGFECRRW